MVTISEMVVPNTMAPHLVPEIATFWFLLLLRSVVFRFVHKMEVNAARISGIGRLVSLSTNRVLSPA